jgi:hypothetical protein
MPIGAAIGGGVIAAGGAIGAGAISSHAQTKAAQTAATTAQNTTDANNQLFRDTRAQNIQIASPFYNNGVAAGNALSGLLLGSQPSGSPVGYTDGTPVAAVGGGNGALDAYLAANPDVAQEARRVTADHEFNSPEDYAAWHYQHYGQNEGRAAPALNTPAPNAAGTPASATGALSPWDQFRNSTNYQFRYDQGLKATEGSFATKGALDSGAAEKAKITFGQNFASNELSNYMNLLAGQQNVGLSAGNAIMGVSTNAANNIAGQNTNAGNVAANAALTSGQANANMWGTVGSTAGQLGGALFQYGMGQFSQPQTNFGSASYINTPSPVSLPTAQPLSNVPVNWGF